MGRGGGPAPRQVTVGTTGFARVHGRIPCLATVLVGDDPASHTYVRMKRNRTATVGMESRYVELPASTTTGELIAQIATLSADPAGDGILLQHPVPAHVDERAAFEAIPDQGRRRGHDAQLARDAMRT